MKQWIINLRFKRIAKKYRGILYKTKDGCLAFYTRGGEAVLVKNIIMIVMNSYEYGSQTVMRIFQTSVKEMHRALSFVENSSLIQY